MSSPYLALDIGTRHTGVALSESGHLAQPLTTVTWTPPHTGPMLEAIVELCAKYEVATLLVGIPWEADGSPTSQSVRTEDLLRRLTSLLEAAGLSPEVVRANEYLTTQDALKRFPGTDKDAAAAAVLLQDYLDEKGGAWWSG